MKKALKVLTVNSILIIGIGIVSEIVLESTAVQSNIKRSIQLREWNPNTETRKFVPNETMANSYLDSNAKRVFRLRTDGDGYIMPYSKGATNTIMFLGGSTTECLYMEEDERFPYLVGKYLSSRGMDTRTLNAGVSGNNTIHSINTLLNKGIKEEPKVIVLMHNINDLGLMLNLGSEMAYWSALGTRMDDRALVREEDRGIGKRLRAVLPGITELAIRTKSRIGFELQKSGLRHSIDEQKTRGRATDIEDARVFPFTEMEDRFKINLRMFISIARENGAIPILMTQGNMYRETPDQVVDESLYMSLRRRGLSYRSYKRFYDRFNESIRDVANAEEVVLIDLDRKIPKDKDFFYDMIHMNSKGAARTARLISDSIEPILMNLN